MKNIITRAYINAAIEEFLAKGGEIIICPPRHYRGYSSTTVFDDLDAELISPLEIALRASELERDHAKYQKAPLTSKDITFLAGKIRWALNSKREFVSNSDYGALYNFSKRVYKGKDLNCKQAKYLLDILMRYESAQNKDQHDTRLLEIQEKCRVSYGYAV